MKAFDYMKGEAKPRVEQALRESVDVYINKLDYGFYQLAVEAPLQLHVMKLLEQRLDQYTLSADERFIVDLEKNIPLGTKKDEVDGVVEYYYKGKLKELYLIEFKYKKPKDGGPNSCNIDAYVDIYELEQQKKQNSLVKGCYFVFATSDKEFTIPGARSTANRMIFPLHDGYVIQKRRYVPLAPAAVKQLANSGYSELKFINEHKIEYTYTKTAKGDDYWFFVLDV